MTTNQIQLLRRIPRDEFIENYIKKYNWQVPTATSESTAVVFNADNNFLAVKISLPDMRQKLETDFGWATGSIASIVFDAGTQEVVITKTIELDTTIPPIIP